MQREMRVGYGPTPRSLFDKTLVPQSWQLYDEQFLLRGDGEHYFHYQRGAGVTIDRGKGAVAGDESLWLNGSVYAAVASLNGMLPIHASAVAYEGAVYAFTGPSGSGKSTLVAALGNSGLPMFCDDTLVLDLSDPHGIHCLPGHKRLKLHEDSIALSGAEREEEVARSTGKYYARPAAGTAAAVLPLARLIFLEEGDSMTIEDVPASDRFVRAADDHYTWSLFEAARNFDRTGAFAHRARIARQVSMAKFIRPIDASRFAETVSMAASYLKA